MERAVVTLYHPYKTERALSNLTERPERAVSNRAGLLDGAVSRLRRGSFKSRRARRGSLKSRRGSLKLDGAVSNLDGAVSS